MRIFRRRDIKPALDVPEDFDDEFYLSAHDDVAAAVAQGDFTSGYEHFVIHGRSEKRTWSNKSGLEPYGRRASLGEGLYSPEALRTFAWQHAWQPKLSGQRARGQLLILVPHLRTELFYAGYSSFFAECAEVAQDFSDVRVICLDDEIAPGLLERYVPHATVCSIRELESRPIDEPELIITFDTTTTLIACDVLGLAHRTIYYCQDFEAGFHPYGYPYVRALRALHVARFLVVSTPQLKTFLDDHGYVSTPDVCVTVPAVTKLRSRATEPGRVFVYFRPESFNSRNMADLLLEKIVAFCDTHSGYEFLLVGTVATDLSMAVGDNTITILSKLDFEQYEDLAMSSAAAISMIFSAHPGVVAYQTALSGIPTITNVFDNRSADDIVALSKNLIPYDLVRDSFDEVLQRALNHTAVHQEEFVFGQASSATSVEFMRGVGRRVSSV